VKHSGVPPQTSGFITAVRRAVLAQPGDGLPADPDADFHVGRLPFRRARIPALGLNFWRWFDFSGALNPERYDPMPIPLAAPCRPVRPTCCIRRGYPAFR